ncbi:MAG TPA: hypothetical protein VFB79_21415 [Candidatus Angelobacter sp.]|nr:hypothetical protein [Candidatus Angelobacter sp.]
MTPRITEEQEAKDYFDSKKHPDTSGDFDEFVTRKEPRLFKFEKPGDKITGHLSAFLKTNFQGNDRSGVTLFFCVEENTNQFVKVHATRQMLEKISTQDVGRKIRITYQGENTEVRTVGNKMRNFTVEISKAPPRTDLLMDTTFLEMVQEDD